MLKLIQITNYSEPFVRLLDIQANFETTNLDTKK